MDLRSWQEYFEDGRSSSGPTVLPKVTFSFGGGPTVLPKVTFSLGGDTYLSLIKDYIVIGL